MHKVMDKVDNKDRDVNIHDTHAYTRRGAASTDAGGGSAAAADSNFESLASRAIVMIRVSLPHLRDY